MAARPAPTLRHDGIAFVLGVLFVVVGVSAIHNSVTLAVYSNDWIFGVCSTVFGSMIVGVAVNHISVGRRSRKLNDVKGGKK